MAQKMTADHKLAADSLRLTNGIPGITGSPYFCFVRPGEELAFQGKGPSRGLYGDKRRGSLLQVALICRIPISRPQFKTLKKLDLLVYSIYFRNTFGGGSNSFSTVMGQSYLLQLATETGGQFYSLAMSSPVSFQPFLKQFKQSLERQYLLTFAVGEYGLAKGAGQVESQWDQADRSQGDLHARRISSDA